MDNHIEAIEIANLFLSWGADFTEDPHSMGSRECCIARAQAQANSTLVSILIRSKLVGRRCELIDLASHSRPELTGRTCIVEEYIKYSNRYKVTVEGKEQEQLIVSENNLKRRDLTPENCCFYIEFKNGRFIRKDFDTINEYQAFLSTLNRDVQPAVDPDAEAKADQAAADLLAELGLDDDVTEKKTKSKAQSTGKSKNKKKGKKGKK